MSKIDICFNTWKILKIELQVPEYISNTMYFKFFCISYNRIKWKTFKINTIIKQKDLPDKKIEKSVSFIAVTQFHSYLNDKSVCGFMKKPAT